MPCLSVYLPACVFPFSSDFKAILCISFSYIISSISRENFFASSKKELPSNVSKVGEMLKWSYLQNKKGIALWHAQWRWASFSNESSLWSRFDQDRQFMPGEPDTYEELYLVGGWGRNHLISKPSGSKSPIQRLRCFPIFASCSTSPN